MKKIVEFLNANPVQYLATVGRDGKAKCRPFMFSGVMDGKLWFCTNNQKDVYLDMQENPEIEISVSSPEYAWSVSTERLYLRTTRLPRRCAFRTPSLRGSIRPLTIPFLRSSIWTIPTA